MRNPTTYDETSAKGSSELFKGIYGIEFQAIEPSHCHRSQAGWKYLAHQSFFFRMDNHPLIELALMFYRVRFTIVKCEHGLMKSSGKFCPPYLVCER